MIIKSHFKISLAKIRRTKLVERDWLLAVDMWIDKVTEVINEICQRQKVDKFT